MADVVLYDCTHWLHRMILGRSGSAFGLLFYYHVLVYWAACISGACTIRGLHSAKAT